MWGNLADRLGATDINSALEKIGNAVAPRAGDDDEEYYDDDDDGVYDDGVYDDSDYYDYDNDNDNDDAAAKGVIVSKVATTPFRLAGMLATRALGDNQHRSPVENADYTESNDDDDDEGIHLFTQKLLQKDEEYMVATRALGDAKDVTNDLAQTTPTPVVVVEKLPQTKIVIDHSKDETNDYRK
jgi:hypothetical protein